MNEWNPPVEQSQTVVRFDPPFTPLLPVPTPHLRWYGNVLEQMFIENGQSVWRAIPRIEL